MDAVEHHKGPLDACPLGPSSDRFGLAHLVQGKDEIEIFGIRMVDPKIVQQSIVDKHIFGFKS